MILRVVALAGAVVTASTIFANATSITVTGSDSGKFTSSASGETVNSSIAVTQFDRALGTLDSVDVKYDYRLFGTLTFHNNTSGGLSLGAWYFSEQTNAGFMDLLLSGPTIQVSGADYVNTLCPGCDVSTLLSGNSQTTTTSTNNSSTLAAFVAGPVQFSTTNQDGFDALRGGAISVIPSYSFENKITVTYNYTPVSPAQVPLPAAAILLASGLGGLGLLRRRSA